MYKFFCFLKKSKNIHKSNGQNMHEVNEHNVIQMYEICNTENKYRFLIYAKQ